MNRVVAFTLLGALVLFSMNNATALALTPESPKVRKLTADAVKFLESGEDHAKLGGVCLKGLACYKYYHRYKDLGVSDIDRPQVKYAVNFVRNQLKSGLNREDETLNYSLGIAIIFLCEIDGNQKAYRSEIQQLLNIFYAAQRPNGSWGYPNKQTGDMSQTQYGVLGSWYAMKKGYQVPANSLERAVDWIIRTQDPSGQFPYQGYDPGPGNYNRVRQGAVRFTMSPAALGCLYIAEDLAGLSGQRQQVKKTDVFKSTKAVARPKRISVNGPMLQRAIADGNRWYNANHTLAKLDTGKNFHYYLYSFERYHAMKSFSEGTRGQAAPWYDAGVGVLAETQDKDGMWSGTRGPIVSTSFAMLFLLRSMEIAIEDTAGGQSRGGYQLPDDLTRLTADNLRDGQVVGPKKATDIEAILKLIAEGDLADLTVVMPSLDDYVLDEDRIERKKQVTQLRATLASGGFRNRLAAAKMIAGSGDIENVPHLIFALTDGDHRVMRTARNGLRLISRKFKGFGLSDLPTTEEKELAAKNWRRWYQSVRPEVTVEGDLN
jgi:hypothetical protein